MTLEESAHRPSRARTDYWRSINTPLIHVSVGEEVDSDNVSQAPGAAGEEYEEARSGATRQVLSFRGELEHLLKLGISKPLRPGAMRLVSAFNRTPLELEESLHTFATTSSPTVHSSIRHNGDLHI